MHHSVNEATYRVFDWNAYTIGLPVVDLASYVVDLRLPYTEVRSMLGNLTNVSDLSRVNYLFFFVAYIFMATIHLTRRKDLDFTNAFLAPAIDDFKTALNEFMTNELAQTAKELAADLRAADDSVFELRRELAKTKARAATAETARAKADAQVRAIERSRSWKITAPLRAITGRLIRR